MSQARPPVLARPATLDDLEAVARLNHRIFGVEPTVASLAWKFTDQTGRLAGSTVLTSGGTVVGFLGQIPVRMSVGGHEQLATQTTDVGILEEYRRLDTFLTLIQTSINELKVAGVTIAYGTANAAASLTLSSLLGQTPVASIPLLVRPFANLCLPTGRRKRAPATHPLSSALLHDTLWLTSLPRFDDRFDRFWQRIRNDYPIMLVRDADALNRRFFSAPGGAYECLGIENMVSGEIEGYAILAITHRGDQVRGRICDLVTPRQGRRHLVHALISAALKWFRTQQAEVADVWMFPHTHLRLALQLHGFIPRRTRKGGFRASFVLPGARPDLPNLARANQWFLSMSDSDTV